MKINILYIFWFLALVAFVLIFKHLQTQSTAQLFGIAETEGQILKLDYTARVIKCFATEGAQVKAGDTLMTFEDASIVRRSTSENTASNQINVEKIAKNNSIEKEKALYEQTQTANIKELEGKIALLRNEIELQNNLKKAISENSISNNGLKHQAIKSLEEEIEQIRLQTQAQIKLYNVQRSNNNKISGSKSQEMRNALHFIDQEKQKLILLAPYDGYIEQVNVSQNEVVPEFKDLLKINPKQPNKIIGFIHESINVHYNLGDTLTLSSAMRPEIIYKAQLVGVSPKLVELPFRLRKFTEMKAWGREIYINLPVENDFFIGEKVMIQMH